MATSEASELTIEVDASRRVSALLRAPADARACYVLAHGAGAGMRHPFMAEIAEALAARGIVVPILHLGLPDAFIDHGDPAFLLSHVGLDAKGIAASIRGRFEARGKEPRVKPAA